MFLMIKSGFLKGNVLFRCFTLFLASYLSKFTDYSPTPPAFGAPVGTRRPRILCSSLVSQN